jgi:hypothetical protein
LPRDGNGPASAAIGVALLLEAALNAGVSIALGADRRRDRAADESVLAGVLVALAVGYRRFLRRALDPRYRGARGGEESECQQQSSDPPLSHRRARS